MKTEMRSNALNIILEALKSRFGSIIFALHFFFIGSLLMLIFPLFVPPPRTEIPASDLYRIILNGSITSILSSLIIAPAFGFGIANWFFSKRYPLQQWADFPIDGRQINANMVSVVFELSISYSAFSLLEPILRIHNLLNFTQRVIFVALVLLEIFGLTLIAVSGIIFLVYSASVSNLHSTRRILPFFFLSIVGAIGSQFILIGGLGNPLSGNAGSVQFVFESQILNIIQRLIAGDVVLDYFIILSGLLIAAMTVFVVTGKIINQGLEKARRGDSLHEESMREEFIEHPSIEILRIMLTDQYTVGRPFLIAIILGMMSFGFLQLMLNQPVNLALILMLLIPTIGTMESLFVATIAGKNTLNFYRESPNGIRFYFGIQVCFSSLITLIVSIVSICVIGFTIGYLPSLSELNSYLIFVPISVIISVMMATILHALLKPTSIDDPVVILIWPIVITLNVIIMTYLSMASLITIFSFVIFIAAISFTLMEEINR